MVAERQASENNNEEAKREVGNERQSCIRLKGVKKEVQGSGFQILHEVKKGRKKQFTRFVSHFFLGYAEVTNSKPLLHTTANVHLSGYR